MTSFTNDPNISIRFIYLFIVKLCKAKAFYPRTNRLQFNKDLQSCSGAREEKFNLFALVFTIKNPRVTCVINLRS